MEYLKNDLSQAQIAHDDAEAREQEVIVDCQCMLKVFKFKKYKEGYEDGKRGTPPKYSLHIRSYLKGESQDLLEPALPTLLRWGPLKTVPLGMRRP